MKFNCNILEDDYITVTRVEEGIQKDNEANFIDLQMYDDDQDEQLGVTLSLQSTKKLIEKLQKLVDENNRL